MYVIGSVSTMTPLYSTMHFKTALSCPLLLLLHEERAFVLKFSAMEIYNEAVRDLLSNDVTPLRLLDDPERGTIVERLTKETVRDWDHLQELLSICEAQRQIGETGLNETSSRSHQILKLTIGSSSRELLLGAKSSSFLSASVNFVDLAGSERASQSLSAGTRLKEGCHINRSLLTLGTVIRKLSKGRTGHIPYRDSKLTRILQSSLGGNARTAIICTMSPARSHVEQSRNTLSFAACAKEVATAAKVNVVMSEKELAKELQKELARLVNELKCPGSTSALSHYEAQLNEKDVQIQKVASEKSQYKTINKILKEMEMGIKDLIQQRDLAQSRLKDLLQVVGDDQSLRIWTQLNYQHNAHEKSVTRDEISLSEASGVAKQCLDLGLIEFNEDQSTREHSSPTCDDHFLDISKIPGKPSLSCNTTPELSMSSHQSVANFKQNSEMTSHIPRDDTEDVCKEVRCIEIDESSTGKNEGFNVLNYTGNENHVASDIEQNVHIIDKEPEYVVIADKQVKDPENIFLDKKIRSVQKCLNNLVMPDYDKIPEWMISSDLSTTRESHLTKSRSCRAALMTRSYPIFQEVDESNEHTPISAFDRDFPVTTGGLKKRPIALNCSSGNEIFSKDCSGTSEHCPSAHLLRSQINLASQTNITSIDSHVQGLNEKCRLQNQEKKFGVLIQVSNLNVSEDFTARKTTKDASPDPIHNSLESQSNWTLEFEREQREIINLWNACYVSLVHRTNFFLLFKGDPTDSIHMEVKLRRLAFLKKMLSQEKVGKSSLEDGFIVNPASSMKALRREREFLSKQMLKKFSPNERENFYRKWGIGLGTKQRRLQLVCRLWTETKDMDHIKESAEIVARLIGFSEASLAHKEMLTLNFSPKKATRRSYSWKNSKLSFL